MDNRRDMFFRLNGFSILIPPLRERATEIGPLARAFAKQACFEGGRERTPQLSCEALATLERHSWPGNIRELRNVVERAVVLCTGEVIEPFHLGLEEKRAVLSVPPAFAATPSDQLDERARIVAALNHVGGNQTKAAEALGMYAPYAHHADPAVWPSTAEDGRTLLSGPHDIRSKDRADHRGG